MIKPDIPANEAERIKALNSFRVLDTLTEQEYDNLTMLAAHICETPISLVSLVDPERQWFKSHHGLDATETPRELAFCAHAINKPDELLIVPDARKDERFHDNPLSTGAPNVIFYAGAPLNTADGYSLGTLCVIDDKPKNLNESQKKALKALADQVISLLELRRNNFIINEQKAEFEAFNKQLDAFSYRLTHDLKAPIRGIKNISQWLMEEYESQLDEQATEWVDRIQERSSYMESLVDGMLKYSKASKQQLHYEEFNLKQQVEDVFRSVQTGNVSLNCVGCDVSMKQSKIALTMIFHNLMTNSIKFSDRDDCQITVTYTMDNDLHTISFEDNGPGIESEYREKVFDIFETLGSKSAESTGIGLATVTSAVERLNGSVELVDRENGAHGVKFVIKTPVLN